MVVDYALLGRAKIIWPELQASSQNPTFFLCETEEYEKALDFRKDIYDWVVLKLDEMPQFLMEYHSLRNQEDHVGYIRESWTRWLHSSSCH